MSLNLCKGNMYEFVTHTFNTIKGKCYHDCEYCYMKRFGEPKPMRFDEKELKTNLGHGNYIFVGSSCDMWAKDIPELWIEKTIIHLDKYDNKYLFQTKNPSRFFGYQFTSKYSFCTTLESNRFYPEIMKESPQLIERVESIEGLYLPNDIYITIEPIMDFDLKEFVEMIKRCRPLQVNIGADSGGHKLPEPPKEKILELIQELECFTTVHQKKNLKRLLK